MQQVGLVPASQKVTKKKKNQQKRKTSPFSLGLNFCLYPFSEEKLPFALQKNSMHAQWGKAATQGLNGKKRAQQIIFKS